MWKKIAIGLGGIGLIGLIGLIGSRVYISKNTLGVVSPLPDDYKKSEEYKVIFETKTTTNYPPNEYFPKTLVPRFTREDLGVDSQAYAVMDRDTGELLLARNLTTELPIASVTKIMTAIVTLEKTFLDTEFKVSSEAASIGEAEMGLTAGETLTVEELLYGLLLPSGNDAAETLAQNLGPGRIKFIKSMNQKAVALGMYDTFYFNPTGLDGERQEYTNYSTCLDQLALANYALKNEEFAKIVDTHNIEFPYAEGKHKYFYLENILSLERAYPGIKGIKPGVTDFAGETLVSYAENGGKKILVVLLNSQHSLDDARKIYDFIFSSLGVKIPTK